MGKLYTKYGKRLLDLIFSSVFLVIFSPVFLLIVALMLIISPGPVIYRGKRIGLHEREFDILKFRTMVVNAESLGGSCTTSTDPRVTPLGRILRKVKIDELPQLWNVFRGDMSLVGPRPDTPHYISKISKDERRKIFSVRPGITDLATLEIVDEEETLSRVEDPDQYYETVTLPWKVRKQTEYVESISPWLDLKIILKTIYSIFVR